MNKRITVYISTNIHIERVKAEYIPNYISENSLNIHELKERKFFKKWKLPKLNEFPDISDVQIFTMICI